ncbi:hypothetical protein Tco_0461594 [Tanacetum coccineum]
MLRLNRLSLPCTLLRKIVKLWFAISAHHEVDTILAKLHLPFHKEDGKRLRKELELLWRVVRSDARVSQMLTQLESQPEIGGCSESESGGGGDDELGGDEEI